MPIALSWWHTTSRDKRLSLIRIAWSSARTTRSGSDSGSGSGCATAALASARMKSVSMRRSSTRREITSSSFLGAGAPPALTRALAWSHPRSPLDVSSRVRLCARESHAVFASQTVDRVSLRREGSRRRRSHSNSTACSAEWSECRRNRRKKRHNSHPDQRITL